MGPPRCFLRLGGLCSGAMFPSGWGHSALTGHTQEWGSLSDVLSSILPKKLIEPPGARTFPQLCLILLWQLEQGSGLEKGEGGDPRVGPELGLGLSESHV